MAGDLTSLVTLLPQLTRGSFQVVWSAGATPVGDLYLQGSDDYALDPGGTVQNAGTWTNMDVSVAGATVSAVPISGDSGSAIIEFTTGVNAIRLFYDRSSGSGTLNGKINAKVG